MTRDQLQEAFWEKNGLADQIYDFLVGHMHTVEVTVEVEGCSRTWEFHSD